MGTSCGAGSNKSLCVVGSSTQCKDAVCLWDAVGEGGQQAYCTVACDPADTTSCPTNYACKAQQCSGDPKNICVFVTKPSTMSQECAADPVLAGARVSEYRVVSPDLEVILAASKTVASDYDVFVRNAGTTSKVGQTRATNKFLGITGGSVWYSLNYGEIAQIRKDGMSIVRVEDCGKDNAASCIDLAVEAVTSDRDGAVSVLYQRFAEGSSRRFAAVLRGTTSMSRTQVAADSPAARQSLLGGNLADGSYLTPCSAGATPDSRTLCSSTDFLTWNKIALPDGQTWSGTQLAMFGETAENATLLSDTGVVVRSISGTWTVDAMPKGTVASNNLSSSGLGFSRLGSTLLVTRAENSGLTSYRLNDGCWQKPSKAIDAQGDRIASASAWRSPYQGSSFCMYPIPE
jgi:hypothetical protein